MHAGSIFEFAQRLGFNTSQIHFALDRAVDKRLLERSTRYTSDSKIADFRMTTVGAYTLSKLMRWFVYHDAVVVDTPVVDDKIRDAILNVELLDQRANRATTFRTYLDQQSEKFSGHPTAFDWGSASKELMRNIETAQRGAKAAMDRAKGSYQRSPRP